MKNRLIIYDVLTDGIVYDNTTISLKLAHTIPVGSLNNGFEYQCTITAYDIEDNATTSSRVPFVCLTTPLWGFANLEEDQTIRNATYTVNLLYQQLQDEPLNEYKVILYSSGMSQLWESEIRYSTSMSIEIGGLTDSTNYYLRATGKTVNGFYLDTGFIPFSVEYKASSLYSVLALENKPYEGIVKVASNIVVIDGISLPGDPKFLFDELVDLRGNGDKVLFKDGLFISGNFLMQFEGFQFQQNQPLVLLEAIENTPTVFWRKGIFRNDNGDHAEQVYAEVRVHGLFPYVVFSNKLPAPQDMDVINFWLRRISGLYEIKIINKGAF